MIDTFEQIERQINKLHAALSQRPPATIKGQINFDAYHGFVGDVERAANSIRDEFEVLKRERKAGK